MIYNSVSPRYRFIYYMWIELLVSIKKEPNDKDRKKEENRERENREEHMLGVFVVPLGVAGRVAYPPITGSPLAFVFAMLGGTQPSRNYFITQTAVLTCIVPLLHEGAPSNNICDESLAIPSRPFHAPRFYTAAIWSFVLRIYPEVEGCLRGLCKALV